MTVCENEAASLESARGGGGFRAPAGSLVIPNCGAKPRLAGGTLTRSASAMSRSVPGRRDHDSGAPRSRGIQLRASSICNEKAPSQGSDHAVPGWRDHDSGAPRNRRRDSAPGQRRGLKPRVAEEAQKSETLCLQASLLFCYGKRHRSRSTPLRQQERSITAFELGLSIPHYPLLIPSLTQTDGLAADSDGVGQSGGIRFSFLESEPYTV